MESNGFYGLFSRILIVLFLASLASAGEPCMAPWPSPGGWGSFTDVQTTLTTVGSVLAVLMMAFQGLSWMLADGPEERENAKRGIIYIVIGMILLVSAYKLVVYLLCT